MVSVQMSTCNKEKYLKICYPAVDITQVVYIMINYNSRVSFIHFSTLISNLGLWNVKLSLSHTVGDVLVATGSHLCIL